MKTQEEIEQLAKKQKGCSKEYCDSIDEQYGYLNGYIDGYTQCQEDMADEIEKQISDFQHDLRKCTSTYIKENCEGAIFGLNRLLNSLNKQD